MKLAKDATLRDLRSNLTDPDAFVSRAYGVMHRLAKEHGSIVMRLGVTGTGQFPNYRIEHAEGAEPIVAIDGANHEPWPEGESFGGTTTWSEATMSKQDVENLLGEIRNFRRKG